jgi:hypothetical protein
LFLKSNRKGTIPNTKDDNYFIKNNNKTIK